MIMTMERIIGIITRNCNCWASCSEFTMEPTAAHRVLYKNVTQKKVDSEKHQHL